MSIERSTVLGMLKRATLAKDIIVLVSMIVFCASWMLLPFTHQNPYVLFGGILGIGVIANVAARVTICRRMTRCPSCSRSLWQIAYPFGYGRSKATRIREGVVGCPHCNTPFV